ncbi:phenylalanine--tRNA ligase alpha subunit [Neocloeon triangulifer]|uniref:phenylalanine--tRNA ligase alpha subunit n=1 Tax=Neocloeon triangulifer TaxID=2078957 RepID=UPI00286F38D9|nr:phenylalanine--tRNA ligase alpha subunit [Neocloeon triangulifer]
MSVTLPEKILQYLDSKGKGDSLLLADEWKEDSQKIVGAIKSLEALGNVIAVEQYTRKQWELTAEGKLVAEKGSHEAVVYNAVPDKGIPQPELMKAPNAKVGFSKAMSAGWIVMDKSSGQPIIKKKVASIDDVVQINLSQLQKGVDKISDEQKQEYKKRKLLQEVVVKGFHLSKGPEFNLSISKPETDLTPEMIAQGTWKSKQFKEYNLGALGVPPPCGHLHPLLKVRAEFRQIFLEMGFTEMPTNNYVESSFWNFDALFQPQQHPARDAHDTFFLSDPKESSNFPMDYLEKVKTVHSKGGHGSQGYGYDWKIGEAQKNLLRTHSTAVSARMLHKLAKEGFRPVKYFSIDRVFRNETLDATHLAEFHQVEGVIADYDLGLSGLIGVLYEFFKKLGIEKLYFKPAYNPYTEPSMEIFSYHEGLKKWIEIGNSGMFRPEMLLPMGLPENVNIYGWGLSLERPTMIKYGINNIRDLVGPKVDLQMVHDSPICRLDKDDDQAEEQQPLSAVNALEKEWDNITKRIEKLQATVKSLQSKLGVPQQTSADCGKFDVTIFADPMHPPHSIITLINMLDEKIGVRKSSHCHSSLKLRPDHLKTIFDHQSSDKPPNNSVTVIWKSVGTNLEMVVSPVANVKVTGEVNVLRYLSRVLEAKSPDFNWYERLPAEQSSQIDYWLDKAHNAMLKSDTQSLLKTLDQQLINRKFIIGNDLSPADIFVVSVLSNLNLKLPRNVDKWYKQCTQLRLSILGKK